MRLDKFLAETSVGTKKVVKTYIKEGKVTLNEKVVLEPSMQMDKKTDVVKYLGEEVIDTGKVYYMFHKPAGCITARKDRSSKTVLDYFEGINTNGLFPVGRLDKDTEGLLFLTNDGNFNNELMAPEKHVEKKYFFWAFGRLDDEDKKLLETGVSIGEDEALTKPAKVEVVKEGLYQHLKDEMAIGEFIKKKKNLYEQSVVAGYLTISEGRKHQVKRMLKAVGCYVVYLKRISIGEVLLDESLEKGHYRMMMDKEIQKLLGK